MPARPTGSPIVGLLVAFSLILTLPAALVVAIAEWFPTSWFIHLQVMWNDGYYYSKLTFLLTWLALLDVVAAPILAISGGVSFVRGWMRSSPEISSAARNRAFFSRGLRFVVGSGVTAGSLLFLLACFLAPSTFEPIGVVAAALLLFALMGAPIGAVFAIDGLCPTETFEGTVEGHPIVHQPRGGAIRYLRVAGRQFTVPIETWNGTPDGARVSVVLTGFLGTFVTLDRTA